VSVTCTNTVITLFGPHILEDELLQDIREQEIVIAHLIGCIYLSKLSNLRMHEPQLLQSFGGNSIPHLKYIVSSANIGW
jgi:hypothetical protein